MQVRTLRSSLVLGSFVALLAAIAIGLLRNQNQPGWTTVLSALALLGSLLFISAQLFATGSALSGEMTPMRRFPVLLIFLTVNLVFAFLVAVRGGPTGAGRNVSLNTDDKMALHRILDASSWSFRQSQLELRVHEEGAVQIKISGEALQKNRGQDGSLLMPVAMVQQLPSYFKCTEGASERPVEVQAYQVAGGLWCLTALMPLTPQPTSSAPVEGGDGSIELQLKVLVVSSDFLHGLPLLIPTGVGRGEVEGIVSLPSDASVGSLEILRSGDVSGESTNLTLLPYSLTGEKHRAVARLSRNEAVAWDFSNVTFSYSSRGKLFRVLTFAIILLAFTWAASELILWNKYRQMLIRERERIYGMEDRPKGYFRQVRAVFSRRAWPLRFQILLLLLGFALAATLALLVPWVFAQSPSQSSQPPQLERAVTLGEFGMGVEAGRPQADTVTVSLNFFALTDIDDHQTTTEVSIGTGDDNAVNIEDIKATSSDRVTIKQSPRLARLTVPTNSGGALILLKALADLKIERLRMPDSYSKALKESSFVKLEYVLSGAQTIVEHTRGGWLHWFPFDTKSIEVPFESAQPAILSRIEIQRPQDFVGDVSMIGVNGSFVEEEKRYVLDRQGGESRLIIPARENVMLRAHFRRSWFQRLVLTVGQILIAIAAGCLLGFVSSLSEKNSVGAVIQGVGVLGLPWVMRTSVFSTYKDLPSLLSGQAPTLFEVIFLISWLLFASLTIYTCRRWRT